MPTTPHLDVVYLCCMWWILASSLVKGCSIVRNTMNMFSMKPSWQLLVMRWSYLVVVMLYDTLVLLFEPIIVLKMRFLSYLSLAVVCQGLLGVRA